MGDRIVVMNGGVIEQIGTPLEVFDVPANTFVASFVGSPSMNFLAGKVEVTAGAAKMHMGDGSALPLPPAAQAHSGKAVTAGIRPHHFLLDSGGTLRATVKDVQPTGVETILLCQLGGAEILVQRMERLGVAVGETVSLSVDPHNVHVFAADSGRRILG